MHFQRFIRGFLVLVLVAGIRPAQAGLNLVATNFFGGSGDQRGVSIAAGFGSIFVAGNTDANGTDGLAARYTLPLLSSSTPAWTLTWPGAAGGDEFNGVSVSFDALYVAGDSYSRTSDSAGGKENKGNVVRFPLTGATGSGFAGAGWDHQTPSGGAGAYGGGEALWASTIVAETNNNYIYVTGSAQQNGANGGRFYLSKIDTNGTTIWTRDDSASMLNNAYSIGRGLTTLNGFIYVAGFNGDAGNRAYLRKYDAAGTLQWSKTNVGQYLSVTAFGGNIYAAGYVSSGSTADGQVDKWDESGNLVWSQTYDRNSSQDALNGIVGLNSILYAAGFTRGNTAGGADATLLEINPATGALLSTTLYGGTLDDIANGIATDGTDLYVVGESKSFGTGNEVMVLRYSVAAAAPVISTTTLPDGQVGVAYSQTLTASGGSAPYVWTLLSGPLPGGISLSSAGVISGTGSVASSFPFFVRVTDSAALSATQALSILLTNPIPQLVATNFFGGSGDQRGVSIAAGTGAIYVAGNTDANGTDGLAARYTLPLLSSSTPVWTLTWPGAAGGDEFNGLSVSSDALYAAGDSYSRTSDSAGGKENKGNVVRFPLTGATGSGFAGAGWDHQTPSSGAAAYGGGEALWASVIVAETNNNYIYVTGSAQQNSANGGRFYVSKIDTNGTTLWTRDDSASMVNNAYSIGRGLTTLNGYVYVAGFNGDNGNRAYLRKYDAAGNLQWSRTNSGAYSSVTAFGGAIFAAGYVGSGAAENAQVDKWDESGTLQWSQTYDRNSSEDALNGIVGLASRIYAVGYTRGNTAGGADALLLEIEPVAGALVASKVFGGALDDIANGVATDGTDLYVVGESKSFGTGNEVMVLRYSLGGSAAAVVLNSIQVTPLAASIGVSSNLQFYATGTFSDGSSRLLVSPAEAAWTVLPSSIASISSSGMATGLTSGSVMISAYSGTITGSVTLTVTNIPASTTPTVVGFVSIGSQAPAQMAVNPLTDRIYIAGGYAQSPLTVINASTKTAPAVVTTVSSSGGVAVNPNLNRFYASGGFGGSLLVFDGLNNSQIASVAVGYCGGQLDFDAVHNTVFLASQCGGGNDPLHVFDASVNALIAGPLGSGGTANSIRVNSTTGRAYMSRSGGTRVFAGSPGFGYLTDLSGLIAGINPISNLIYLQSGSDLQVLNGNTHSVVATITGAGSSSVGVNTNLNRIYVSDGLSQVKIISGSTHTVLTSFSLGAGVIPNTVMAVDSQKNRLYIVGSSNSVNYLYVVEDVASGGSPVITTTSLPSGSINTVYSSQIVASGGTPPYSWTYSSGSAPSGLSFFSSGLLQGTLTAAGTFTFAVRVADSLSQSATQTFSVVIAPQASLTLTSTNFFGGTGDQRALGLSIAGGAVYLAGQTDANGVDGFAARISLPAISSAVPLWTATWPGASGGDEFNAVSATTNGVYFAGDSYSRTADTVGGKENKGIVVRFPNTGATGTGVGGVTWDRQTPPGGAFGYGGGEALWASLLTTESGTNYIYVTGSGQVNGANGGRLYLTKIDTNGTVQWTRDDSGSMLNNAYSIGRGLAALNGNIYVAGYNGDSGNKAALRKYDSSGNLLWSRTVSAGAYNAVTAFNGFIFAAGTVGSGTNANALIDKWDESGTLVWSRQFDRNNAEDILYGITGLGGRLYAVGSTRGNTAGGADVLLLEFEPDQGTIINTVLYGGASDDIGNAIATDGTDLYIAGESRSYGGGGNDIMLLRYSPLQSTLLLYVTSSILNSGEIGQPYNALLGASGGSIPYSWSTPTGAPLPAGLTLSSAGAVQGTPTNSGTFTFAVRVTDSAAVSATQTVSLTIAATAVSPIQLTATNLLTSTANLRGLGVSVLGSQVVMAGVSSANDEDGFLASFNSVSAGPAWTVTWPGASGGDHFYGVSVASNGVYAAGDSYSRTSDTLGGKENKGLVVKFPLAGPTGTGLGGSTWDKQAPPAPGVFSYGGGESLYTSLATIENGLVVIYSTGNAQANGLNGGRFFLTKMDSSGNTLWTQNDAATMVSNAYSSGRSIAVLNGFIYVAGYNGDAGSRPFLRKYDSSGTLLWSRSGSAGWYNGICSFAGSIFAAGQTGSGTNANSLLDRYDESGSMLWSQQFDRAGAEDILTSVVGLGSRLYAAGSTRGTTAGGSDAIVLEINPNTGDLLSSTLYGGSLDDSANGIATDGVSLFVAGETRSFGALNRAVLLQYSVSQPSATLSIISSVLTNGNFGVPYSFQATAFGGSPPYTWSLASTSTALPSGLSFNSGGLLQGTPSASGVFSNIILQVTDTASAHATRTINLGIIPSNAPPTVTLTSPLNGGSYIAPATINLAATASDPDGSILHVDFYEGTNMVGSANSAPYTATLVNKQAGSYSLRAVAVDNFGAVTFSTNVVITVNSSASIVAINFDSLAPSPATGLDSALVSYLAGFGITVSNISSGTRLAVIDEDAFYGGGVVTASSPRNVFTQTGSNDPDSYTLGFSTPLTSFGLTRAGLTAGSSGVTHPWWRARAFDSSGVELASVGEEILASYSNVPTRAFTLTAPSGSTISSVRIDSDNRHFAAFNTAVLDDFILTTSAATNTPPTVTLSAPANGSSFIAPATVPVSANAADTDGVARVDFYLGSGALLGSVMTPPYNISVGPLGPGTYSFRAVAIDLLGAARSSTASTITVTNNSLTTLVNFDALNAGAGNVSGSTLSNYLSGCGITLVDASFGTRLEVINSINLYGGQAAVSSSAPNLLTQVGLNEAVRFTLQFTQSLQNFRFTRPRLLAGSSGIVHPQWRARAFDAFGFELSNTGESILSSFVDVPAQTFSLQGPGIRSVRFESDGRGFAAFSAVLLDDLVLDSTSANLAPTVTLTSPASGSTFTAPASISLSATASDSDGTISRVEFYFGTLLVASVANSPYTFSATNVPAGTYSVSARAFDNSGASTVSAASAVSVSGSLLSRTMNFDSFDASAAPITGLAVSNYLAAFGATLTNVSPGTRIAIAADTYLYAGAATVAPSRSNLFTQLDSNDPVSYTLRFAQPLESFRFTRARLLAGPSGITHPYWRVSALDAVGAVINVAEEQLLASFSDVPALTFLLKGPGIAAISVYSENRHFAAFNAALLDDFVLTTGTSNNPPTVTLLSPTNGTAFTAPTNLTLQASAIDSDGSIARVDYYANTNQLIGSAFAPPYSVVWSNMLPGVYTLNAVATDNLGASRGSPPLQVLGLPPFSLPPAITQQPQGQTITVSNSALFSVTAGNAGSPAALVYQWRLNGVNIPDATNSTFSVTNARPSDSGSYNVVVINAGGAVSSDPANLVVLADASAQTGQNDNFADRLSINPLFASIVANNVSATKETGEPNHAGKPGGKSVWFTWRASFTGVMALTTRGSGFDTVLAVYTNSSSPAALSNLVLVASDDDSGGNLNSLVVFNCLEGVDYQIALDGVSRGNGNIVLGLPPGGYRVLKSAGNAESLPLIVTQPQGLLTTSGGNAQLTVGVISSTPIRYQWFFNGAPLSGATNATLSLTNLQDVLVGQYTVLAANDAGSTRSIPAYVEFGSGHLSEDKFSNASQDNSSGLLHARQLSSLITVSAGVQGNQTLNNFGSSTEPNEPNHGGLLGGASRWFTFQPGSSGILMVDTIGSGIDTTLAAYTGNDYSNLHFVASDDNSAPDHIRSLLRFNAAPSTVYSIAVDGKNGATGNIKLNWQLGTAPVLTSGATNQVVTPGSSASFTATATGTPAPGYQWYFNGQALAGGTNLTLLVSNVQSSNTGPYTLIISNFAGAVTNSASLGLQLPLLTPTASQFNGSHQFQFRLTGINGSNYAVDVSTNLTNWSNLTNIISLGGNIDILDVVSTNFSRRFYRARPQ